MQVQHKINYYISGTKNMQDDIINYIVDITLNPTILKTIDNEKMKTELINDNLVYMTPIIKVCIR